jgi:DNA-binding GntR family transcriptional regulator
MQEMNEGAGTPYTASSPLRSIPLINLPRSQQDISPRGISDYVYVQLSEVIRDFRLLPGASISELGVGEWLGVSRSPVRQAIARLVDLGLVKVVPQVGSYVAPISIQEVEEAAFIRSALETSAFQRAISASAPDTSQIQAYVDANRIAAQAQDLEAFFESDEKLHQSVFELAGLSRIWEVVRRTKVQVDRLRRLTLPRVIDNPALVEEHQNIVDALRTRNEKLGVTVIQRHATRIFHTIEEHRSMYPDFFTD